jgi:hypothetical protein
MSEIDDIAEPQEFTDPAAVHDERGARDAHWNSRAAIERLMLVEIGMAVLAIEGMGYEPPKSDGYRDPAFGGRLTRQDGQCASIFSWDGEPILRFRWWPGCRTGTMDVEAERLYQRPVTIAMREVELVADHSW